jgi:protein-tyrosine phosphatase
MQRTDASGRELAIDGAFNVRELGGLRTAGGGRVARGLVYRTGDLGGLSRAGAERLRALGVATVIDLRRTTEIERHGRYPFEELGIVYRNLPLLDTPAAEPETRPAELPPDILDRLYRRIADEGGENVGQVLRWFAEPGGLPAVVHCVAGKDRTGTVVAVLLGLLDVADEEITADYALSAPALVAHRAWAGEHDGTAAAWLDRVPPVLLQSDPAAMAAFLAWLRERHGSIAAYAASIGVPPAVQDRLRARLLSAAD